MAKRHHSSRTGGKLGSQLDIGSRFQGMEYVAHQEAEDGSMIHNDYNCMSLLPYNVIIKEYPKIESTMEMVDNDDLNSIDRQIDELDGGPIRRGRSPKRV